MTTTTRATPQATPEAGRPPRAVAALSGVLALGAALGAAELATVQLGLDLGLYAALEARPGSTAAELAEATDLEPRYVREWLQSQAISGFVSLDGEDVDTGRYTLDPVIPATLLDEVSPAYVGALASFPSIIGRITPHLAGAFRTGDGVPYPAYGPEAVTMQERMNRPMFENSLVTEWLPQLPAVHERLVDAERPARVLDACCGAAWSSVVLAEAFPHVHVTAVDADKTSIARARANVESRGVADRVELAEADLAGWAPPEPFDLAFVFEAIHDLPHPVEALASLRRSLRPDGVLVVMDENVSEDLIAPGDEAERFFAAASVIWCTPQGHGPGSEVVGTVMRPAMMVDLAERAGFASTEVAPIEHPFFRFYGLTV